MVPNELRKLHQWLVWKHKPNGAGKKPRKVPFYANGLPRSGELGGASDLEQLVGFDDALKAKVRGGCEGIGFAFIKGDGLVGIDLDKVIDLETGEVQDRARRIVESCDSYTEVSPSRTGLHIFVRGTIEASFKNDDIGVEVYAGGRYFTFTGEHFAGTPQIINDIDPKVLNRLRLTVEKAKQARQAKQEAGAVAQQLVDGEKPGAAPPPAEGGNDFAKVNDAAMGNLDAWVKALFPSAKRGAHGYRIRSKELGRDLEEDLAIHESGIVDFGVADQGDPRQGRRTPIDLVIEWSAHKTPKDALHWLAGQLGVALSRSRAQLRSVDGGKKDAPPSKRGAQAGGTRTKKRQPQRPVDWEEFFNRFTFIYPTLTAYDAQIRQVVKLEAMRANFGRGVVDHWQASADRRSVTSDSVVFDPALPADAEGKVNLFHGMEFEAKEGCCDKLLVLLHWLCGEDDKVFEWVLKWTAYPLRHPGTKMATAVVMYGHEGTGKNLFWGAISEIYGEYGGFITQFQLQSQFNDWASRKLFVVANEVITRMELRHLVGYLKTLITEGKIPIEAKSMPVRMEDNRMQLVFLSNELRPLHMGPADRRYMAIRTPNTRDDQFYRDVSAELAAGGAAALYHYLLHNVDLSEFTPHTKPISTQAKQDLIELGLSSTQLYWEELHGGLLPMPYVPCLVNDAYRSYTVWCQRSGVKMPDNLARFSHEFMSMNGVSRKIMHVADPDRKGESMLPAEKRPQRRVFNMGSRPDDVEPTRWVEGGINQFRNGLKAYIGERQVGASDGYEDMHP